MRRVLALSLTLLLASAAFAQWGPGPLFIQPSGSQNFTHKSATDWPAADAAIPNTGIGIVGPGTEGLTMPGYRAGVCWIWQRYDAYRIAGTPFESWPGGVRRFRADSTGISVTGKAVISDSLRAPRVLVSDSLRAPRLLVSDSLRAPLGLFSDSLRARKILAQDSIRAPQIMATNGIISRLGPASGPTSGGAIRTVDGVTFTRTRAGIQQAINEAYDAGGGIAWLPSGGTVTVDSTLLLRNRVQLVGPGTHSTPTLLKAANGVSLRALAENADTTGSQQYVGISGLAFDGNSSGGASVAYGVRYKDVFIGSYIRDTRVANCTGQGLRLESDASGLGPLFVENFLSNDNGGDGICLTGPAMTSVWMTGLDIERWGTGCAGLRLNGTATGSSSFGAVVDGAYFEAASDATASGVVIGDMHNVSVNNIDFNPTNGINYPVKIEGAATTGPFSAWGARITNVRASNDTILFDQVNNHAITGSGGSISVIPEYIVANGAQSFRRESLVLQDSLRVVGRTLLTDTLRVQGRVDLNEAMLFRKGADITAASTIAIGVGNCFTISGATTITDITGPSLPSGKQQLVTFFFSNTGVTITDTNHWQLNGNFVDDGVNGVDALTGLWGGTNFIELARSHN